ncbi:DUF4124 domain-containing protein [Marinobacter sp. 1-3A]|nr:DUF4124 domain-containing protein [Marinobacter sp. 1-3A]
MIAAFFCLFTSLGLQAGIYKWVDDDGRTHFSDKPPPNQQKRNTEVSNKPAKAPVPSVQAQSQYRQPGASDALRVRKLFENEEFGELNSVLADRLQAVKKDITNELHLRDTYQIF